MRGNVHVRFGGRKRGNGAGATWPPRLLPTRHLPMNRDEANLFFRLVARRYERASLIITSNKSFIDWGEVLVTRFWRPPSLTACSIIPARSTSKAKAFGSKRNVARDYSVSSLRTLPPRPPVILRNHPMEGLSKYSRATTLHAGREKPNSSLNEGHLLSANK